MADNEQTNEQRKVIRLIRPSVVVLVGPAGCGKSTFAAGKFRPSQVISSDRARLLVCDDERDQRFNPQAFALVHFLIEQRLGINRLCVVDSTALTAAARRSLIELARRHRVPCEALVLDVPLQTCLERDAKRERSVGAAVIERQFQAFEQAKGALAQEGFDRVLTLCGDELERVEFEIQFRPVARPAPEAARSQGARALRPGRPGGFQRPEGRPSGPRPNAPPRPAAPRPAHPSETQRAGRSAPAAPTFSEKQPVPNSTPASEASPPPQGAGKPEPPTKDS